MTSSLKVIAPLKLVSQNKLTLLNENNAVDNTLLPIIRQKNTKRSKTMRLIHMLNNNNKIKIDSRQNATKLNDRNEHEAWIRDTMSTEQYPPGDNSKIPSTIPLRSRGTSGARLSHITAGAIDNGTFEPYKDNPIRAICSKVRLCYSKQCMEIRLLSLIFSVPNWF